MTRKQQQQTLVCLLLGAAAAATSNADVVSAHWNSTTVDAGCARPKLAAVVFPQFHKDPTNDELWGEGYTEWVALNKTDDPALPRPIEPLGYYDLMEDDTMELQAELAKAHGVSAFLYYHYWFEGGRRALDAPVAKLLKRKTPRFPFALVWALSSWTPRWHGPNQTTDSTLDASRFPKQKIDEVSIRQHLEFLEKEVWSDDRYVRIDGRPLFILHAGGLLDPTYDSAAFVAKYLKEHAKSNPYVGMTFRNPRPKLYNGKESTDLLTFWEDRLAQILAPFDFGVLWEARTDGLPDAMDSLVDKAVCDAKKIQEVAPTSRRLSHVHWELGAFAGFDNIARHGSAPHLATRVRVEDARTGRDRPAEFSRLLATLAAVPSSLSPVERAIGGKTKCPSFVAINAWNEWGEGNVLEPNDIDGYGMLEATKRFANGQGPEPDEALLASCDENKPPWGYVAADGSVDLQRLRQIYKRLDDQLETWRSKPLDQPLDHPHLDDWRGPLNQGSDAKSKGAGMVFVIGMHKTGTTSLKRALASLGYDVFQLDWKGFEGAKRCFPEGANAEVQHGFLFTMKGRDGLIYCLKQEGIFEMFNAFQDTPFYGLVSQLVRHFPQARFVYLRRDLDAWLASAIGHFVSDEIVRDLSAPLLTKAGTWARGKIIEAYHGTMYGHAHAAPKTKDDAAVWMAGFTQQLEEVFHSFLPHPDRLLVMDLQKGDGMNVLAPFLGRPDAAGWPMPAENSKRARLAALRGARP